MPETIKTFTSSNKGLSENGTTVDINGNYISYSGCDIIASINVPIPSEDGSTSEKTYILGSLQTISVSTYQDKMPVRAIGNVNALDYTMGPRTIAGSLVFAVFDKHFADNILKDLGDESRTILVDEIPSFDITISYANEYGSKSRMALYGVNIIEEGQVISINDVYTENTYKYCALSQERLNKEEKGSSKSKEIESNIIADKNTIDEQLLTPGKDIIENNNFSGSQNTNKSISLYVTTENATSESDIGIANFTISPKQESGYIYIKNVFGEIIKTISVGAGDNIFSTQLQIGSYSAQFKNEIESKISNDVEFAISSDREQEYEINNEPLYEMNNLNIYHFLSNDDTHNEYVAAKGKLKYEDIIKSENATIGKIVDNKFKITLDEDNQYYTIFTRNENSYSYPKYIKTNNISQLYKFKEYIYNNKYNLINDYNDYIDKIDELEKIYNNNLDIIENILMLKNDDIKKELLYYASIYNDNIIKSNNKNITFRINKKSDSSFFNTIEHNIVDNTLYMESKNGKDYFINAYTNLSENVFDGKENIKYSTYDISKNNIKSIKYSFVCFSPETEFLLSKYKKKNISMNESLKNKYSKLSNEELKYANIKDKLEDEELLFSPATNFDYDNCIINMDVDYKSSIYTDEYRKYYIVIVNIDDSIGSYPKQKIETKLNRYEILDSTNSYIYKDNIYISWIEDENFSMISNPTIISTFKDKEDWISYIEKEDLNRYIKSITSNLYRINKNTFNFITTNSEETQIKNIREAMISELITYNYLNEKTILDDLYELSYYLYYPKYIGMTSIKDIYINKDKTLIKFLSNNKFNIIKISVSSSGDIKTEKTNSNYISLDNTGYSIIFCIEENNIQSNIIVFDNKNKTYTTKLNIKEM